LLVSNAAVIDSLDILAAQIHSIESIFAEEGACLYANFKM
jgi:hypothetical protein